MDAPRGELVIVTTATLALCHQCRRDTYHVYSAFRGKALTMECRECGTVVEAEPHGP
jgi:uncharacterized Zn finger protein